MSNAIFPTLAGQSWPRLKAPRFNTELQRSDAGRRWAVARALYANYKLTISYDYLSAADLVTMSSFFKARKGAFDTFLFDDRDDYLVSTPQVLGVGNGTSRAFQLVRNSGGVVEPVGPLNGTPVIRVNAGATGAYTADDYGLITFTTAPPAGQVVDWTGSYYWRVAFAKDEQQYTEFMRNFWYLKTVELETIKP